MLISYNRSVDIRQPFTHDPRIVSRALFELEKMSGHATQRQREYRDMRKLIRNSDSVASAVGRVRQYAASVSSDLRFTLSALTEVIDSLAGLPGRKALLYVSDGLPMVPARGLYVAMQRKFEDMSVLSYAREYDATRRFRQLAAKANTGRITFYTVDATGLQAYTSGQAEVGGTSSVDGLDSFVDSVSSDNLQSSVRFLAERTGGSAIVNVNDIGAGLSRVAADFSTYYSLGFPSSHSGDGRYHTIEVKLKQKGYVARHREGYRDKPVSARMEDSTLSSLKYGYQRNPLAVDLLIGQGVPYDGDYYAVPILIKIPLRNIVLIPRETVHEARAKVFLTAMDDSGDVADVQQSTIRIKIPIDELEAAMQQYYSFEARLLMRPGNHKVAVALRDEFGGIYSVITKYVQVGS